MKLGKIQKMYHSHTYGEPFCEVWAQSEDFDFFRFFGVCDKSFCFFQIMKKILRKWQKQRQFTNMNFVLYLLRPKSSLQVENSVSYQHLKKITIIPIPQVPVLECSSLSRTNNSLPFIEPGNNAVILPQVFPVDLHTTSLELYSGEFLADGSARATRAAHPTVLLLSPPSNKNQQVSGSNSMIIRPM